METSDIQKRPVLSVPAQKLHLSSVVVWYRHVAAEFSMRTTHFVAGELNPEKKHILESTKSQATAQTIKVSICNIYYERFTILYNYSINYSIDAPSCKSNRFWLQ